MAEYFAMGGYAGFVWPAYAITAVVTVGLVLWSLRSYRQAQARVASLEGASAGGGEAQ